MTSDHRIHAEPTKEFFIEVLTRDIGLKDAIIDLLDNSIDAAHSFVGLDGPLNRFEVHLAFDAESFTIWDTCGGIAPQIAENYAFRFGKVPGAPRLEGSIGQFGVGMKRALFKLGKAFTIESQTEDAYWSVSVDTAEWREAPGWMFEFGEGPTDRDPTQGNGPGTKITVTELHNETRAQFGQRDFVEDLKKQIALRAGTFISRGLAVTVDGLPLAAHFRELLTSDELSPRVVDFNLAKGESRLPVRVHVVTGVGPSEPREAGWYVYCNGRLILGPDRSPVTGWGLTDEERMPSYHNQFARFRGYASFFSEDATALPWNTTKSNLDQGHATYLIVRPKMIEAARPVIDFLNAVKDEQEEARTAQDEGIDEPDQLQTILSKAGRVPVEDLTQSSEFTAPTRSRRVSRPATKGPRRQSIQFTRPVGQINELKGFFEVGSASAVGERCFDYVYDEEIEDGA